MKVLLWFSAFGNELIQIPCVKNIAETWHIPKLLGFQTIPQIVVLFWEIFRAHFLIKTSNSPNFETLKTVLSPLFLRPVFKSSF